MSEQEEDGDGEDEEDYDAYDYEANEIEIQQALEADEINIDYNNDYADIDL